MKMKIIEDGEESLDDLVVRARTDSRLREIIQGIPLVKGTLVFATKEAGQYQYDWNRVKKISDKYTKSFTSLDDEIHFLAGAGFIGKFGKDDFVGAIAYDINVICGHNGKIYLGGKSELDGGPGIIVALNEVGLSKIIRSAPVTALCLYNGKMYDASGGRVMETKRALTLAEFHEPVNAICQWENKLCIAVGNRIAVTAVKDTKLGIVNNFYREGQVRSLCIHNGELVDAGDYGVMYGQQSSIKGIALYKKPCNAVIAVEKSRWKQE
jgi:hypothetical protein